jgi:hypothetical protein
MRGDLESRVRGCVLGAALGDAVGGPFEFGPVQRAAARTASPWIDGLCPYEIAPSLHGVWGAQPPAGTGTDDTRYNWLFLELAVELGRMPTGRDLAGRFLKSTSLRSTLLSVTVESLTMELPPTVQDRKRIKRWPEPYRRLSAASTPLTPFEPWASLSCPSWRREEMPCVLSSSRRTT